MPITPKRPATKIAPRTLMKMREKTRDKERKRQVDDTESRRTYTGPMDKILGVHAHVSALKYLSVFDLKSLNSFSKKTLDTIKNNIVKEIDFLEKQVQELNKSKSKFSKSALAGFNIMYVDFEKQKQLSLKVVKEIDEILKHKENK